MQRFDLPLTDPLTAAALASAARYSRRYLVSRRTFCASVTHHEVVAETYDRVLYSIEHRQLNVRQTPWRAGHGPLRALPTPAGRDPWAINPDTLEDDTRAVAACPGCQGGGSLPCATCKGTTWASCPHCFGGKVFAQQKGRLLKNCLYCRGRGTQKCSNCRSGRVDCTQCDASGRVTAWLVLDRRVRSVVTTYPRSAAARVHRQIDSPQDFDSGAWPTRLTRDTGLQRNLQARSELLPAMDVRAERIVGARQQTFATDVHTFTFATPVGSGKVDIAGDPPAVSPSSRWRGLRTRLMLSSALALLSLFGVASLYREYVAQHVWYSRYGSVTPLIGFGVGASLLIAIALACTLVARRARSWFAIAMAAGGTVVFALGVFLAYTYNQPTAAVARRELASGNLPRAQDEGQALIDTRRDIAAGQAVLDALHLLRARRLQSFPELIACIAEPWQADQPRSEAEAMLRSRVQDRAIELYTKHDTRELDRLDAELHIARPDLSDGLQWLLAAVRAGTFLEAADATAASVQLAIVIKLADRVPPAMRPAETELIAKTAAALAPALAAINARLPQDRVKALSSVVAPAREFVRFVGMSPDSVAQGFMKQQRAVVHAIEYAVRRAQLQKAAREREAQTAQPQAGPADRPPIDPYGARSAPVDADVTQQSR